MAFWRLILEYPAVIGLLTSSTYCALSEGYLYLKPKYNNMVIDSTLKAGSKLNQLLCEHHIEWQDVINSIQNLFQLKASDPEFGVILGSTGTGKTFITREAVHGANYVLYHEIQSPTTFPKEISTKPITLDRLFSIFPSSPQLHLEIPDDVAKATEIALEKVAQRSIIIRKKNNLERIPSFVIDGVDLIAKEDERVFIKLMVDLAKKLANDNHLRVILVSSEGHVMPLIESTSSKSRTANVVEVLDITPEEAEKFLMKHEISTEDGTKIKISSELAKEVVEITGPRILHLIRAVNQQYTDKQSFIEEIKRLMDLSTRPAMLTIALKKPHSIEILKLINSKGPMTPMEIMERLTLENMETITSLINANVIRYESNGKINFHSQAVQKLVTKLYLT